MICENCSVVHEGSYGSGRFCSSKCARGFSSRGIDHISLVKEANCPKCGRIHTIRLQASPKFTLCDNCVKRKRLKKAVSRKISTEIKQDCCICCGEEIKRNADYFCSFKCQHYFNYLLFINSWQLGIENGVVGKGGTNKKLRRYFLAKHNNKCSKCGWGERNERTGNVPLELHHIDGNYLNNKENNLILLCPNCHSLTTNYKSTNKNNTRTHR
ncbi:HNH endonuclease [bacterium]|nr:HNH endonuclease [bacterium]